MDNNIEEKLKSRKADGSIRNLRVENDLIDFCSNDYLGFARSVELKNRINNFFTNNDSILNGATGSRLISGNYRITEEVENLISGFHHSEAGLIFNSGYDANLGLYSCLPQRGDTIFYDEYVHASIRDGIRLSYASHYSFRHNDVEHLRELFRLAKGNVYIAIESVYSMDGDIAAIDDIVEICSDMGANLIIDEAHATGVVGRIGEGLISSKGYEDKVFARVHTFGKALGTHGAIVLGSNNLRNYLINFARSFIYTTALPLHSIVSIKCAYELLFKSENDINKLKANIKHFCKEVKSHNLNIVPNKSPIQSIIIEGNEKVKELSGKIVSGGFDIRPILSPTVPKGKERIRICLHAFNSFEEISKLACDLKD
ncbi:MAG: pyridoxal phosphate-dependent aminotransferase family protein [Bacteroidota bacterium]|nr:pyridoxal phosphate-dependent aminotransferase family protein [Bacteroidota bacterium]